jgi:hypothetical protein
MKALVLAVLLAGCAADEVEITGIVGAPIGAAYTGCLIVGTLDGATHLRVRLNGDWLVVRTADRLDYLAISGAGYVESSLPPGYYYAELVDDQDRVVFSSTAILTESPTPDACARVFAWNDLSSSWTWSPSPDDGDPQTREFTIMNVTSRPLTVLRCLSETCTAVGQAPPNAATTLAVALSPQPADVRVTFTDQASALPAGTLSSLDSPTTALLVDDAGILW